MCGKKKSRGDRGDMWWWNEEVKDAITKKKTAFKKLCRFPSEENKTKYKRITNQTRKIVARAMRMETTQELQKAGYSISRSFSSDTFKRIRQKWSKKNEVSHLYRDAVDKKKMGKKAPS